MSAENTKNDRKKVALNLQTYDKLKTFTRFNAVKLRLTLDAMVEIMLQDEALAKRVLEKALETQTEQQTEN